MSLRGWTTTTLGEVLPLAYGKALPKEARAAGIIPVYGSSGVVGKHSAPLTGGPTLIVGRKGNVGEAHLSPVPCWPIDTVYFAECSPSTNLQFFYYLLRFQDLRTLDRSTAVPGLSRDDYDRVKIILPPQPEQQRIVDAIESCLTRLDDAVASLERVQAKLKAYRASVLKAAVEGRLVPTEASLARAEKRDYESAEVLLARILKERRRRWEEAVLAKLKAAGKTPKDDKWKAKYHEPAAPDTSTLPKLPEGWCWASPEQLSSTESYSLGIGPFGSDLKVSDYTKRGTPLVFVRNIRAESFSDDERTRYVSARKAQELQPHQTAPGDILVTKMGDPPGDCCLYPLSRPIGIITADCIKLRLHVYLRCVAFFVHAMRSSIVQSQIHAMTKGVAQKKVSLSRFRRLALPLPPATEQQRVADELERVLSVTDQTTAGIIGERQRCIRLRQAILKWAFEGKLVDQDPTDEPAERLLGRIRAERAADALIKTSGGLRAKGTA